MVKHLCNQCRINPFVKSKEVRWRMDDMLVIWWFLGEDSKRLCKWRRSHIHCHFSWGIWEILFFDEWREEFQYFLEVRRDGEWWLSWMKRIKIETSIMFNNFTHHKNEMRRITLTTTLNMFYILLLSPYKVIWMYLIHPFNDIIIWVVINVEYSLSFFENIKSVDQYYSSFKW